MLKGPSSSLTAKPVDQADLDLIALVRMMELTPCAPQPRSVNELLSVIWPVYITYQTLTAHAQDYLRLNSRHEPYVQIPTDVEAHIASVRAEWETRGGTWDSERDCLERRCHGAATRDRASWQLVHAEMPKEYKKWREQLRTAIEALPRVLTRLQSLPQLPADLCSRLNGSLRTLEVHTTRYFRQPWAFPEDDSVLQTEIGAVWKVIDLLNKAVFPEIAAEPATQGVNPVRSVFKKEGQHWRATFAGVTGVLTDCRGIQFIYELLKSPNPSRPLSVLALTGKVVEDLPKTDKTDETMDPAYIEELENKVEDLKELVEDARAAGNQPRVDELLGEMTKLVEIKRKSLGLGKKPRLLGGQGREHTARTTIHARLQ